MEPPSTPPPSTRPSRRAPRNRSPLLWPIIAIAAVIGLVAAAGIVFLLTNDDDPSDSDRTASSDSPETAPTDESPSAINARRRMGRPMTPRARST